MKGRLVALVILSFLLVLSLLSVTGIFNSAFVKTTGDVIYPGTFCGNGIIEGTEQCDRYKLNGKNCVTQLGTGATGTLRCSTSCIFDTSLCIACKPETNEAFCFRMDKTCGIVIGTDNCGQSRRISCGICSTGSACVNNNCVVGATPTCTSNSTCNDNNTCTLDGCVNGVCQSTVRVGCCTSAAQCNDNNACTTDICSSYICSHVAIPGCGSCVVTTYTPSLNTFCGSKYVTDNCGITSIKTGTLTCSTGYACSSSGQCVVALKANGAICTSDSECTSGACDYDIFTTQGIDSSNKYCHSSSSKCLFYAYTGEENIVGCNRTAAWINPDLWDASQGSFADCKANPDCPYEWPWDNFIDTCGDNSQWIYYADCKGSTPNVAFSIPGNACTAMCVECSKDSQCLNSSKPHCINNKCVLAPTCTPTTCASLGRNCGFWSDNCGGTLNCGTCVAGQTCSNGVCVSLCGDGVCSLSSGETCSTCSVDCGSCFPPCLDSDGGKNYYTYGTIAGPDRDGEGNPPADYCWPDGKGVMEGYCTTDGYVDFYSYACPRGYGCKSGACVRQNFWKTIWNTLV